MNNKNKSFKQIIFSLLCILLLLTSFNQIIFIKAKEQNQLIEIVSSETFPDKDYVERMMRLANLPCLGVGIINPDGSIDHHMFGEIDRETGEPPSKDTIFYAASITKSVTATAIMTLWEQGKIDLDEDINTYLPFEIRHPDYPNTAITTRMLLSHAAGFSNIQWRLFIYFSLLHFPLEWYEFYLTPDNRFYYDNNWNEYAPGEALYYSSIGFDLLSYLVEEVSGESFGDYCQQYILDPLEMKNSSFRLTDTNYDKLTTMYLHLFGIYFPFPYYEIENEGSGGMLSTIEDISHYLLMHMNQGAYQGSQILRKDTIEMMHTPEFSDVPRVDIYGDNRTYAFGWIVWPDEEFNYNRGMQGHLGNVPGSITSMTMLNDTGVVFFANEWSGLSFKQTNIMFMLRDYFHTKEKPFNPYF